MTGSPLEPLQHMLISAAIALGSAALVTLSLVMFLRRLGLHWTWTLPGVLLWPLLWPFDQRAAVFAAGTALFATVTGARWHHDDLRHGVDRAKDARDRRTPFDAGRERMQRRDVRGGRWIDRRGLAVGRDQRGRTVRILVGHGSGRHTLVVVATGSGKTVTRAWIAGRLIHGGQGAVVIDPKGDRLFHEELEHAALGTKRAGSSQIWYQEPDPEFGFVEVNSGFQTGLSPEVARSSPVAPVHSPPAGHGRYPVSRSAHSSAASPTTACPVKRRARPWSIVSSTPTRTTSVAVVARSIAPAGSGTRACGPSGGPAVRVRTYIPMIATLPAIPDAATQPRGRRRTNGANSA